MLLGSAHWLVALDSRAGDRFAMAACARGLRVWLDLGSLNKVVSLPVESATSKPSVESANPAAGSSSSSRSEQNAGGTRAGSVVVAGQ
jgi:Zn-finger nucleic acid-binding protein